MGVIKSLENQHRLIDLCAKITNVIILHELVLLLICIKTIVIVSESF